MELNREFRFKRSSSHFNHDFTLLAFKFGSSRNKLQTGQLVENAEHVSSSRPTLFEIRTILNAHACNTETMGGKNIKVENSDKKLLHWDRFRQQIGFRTSLTWCFLFICVLYILYSSNLILTTENQKCSVCLNASTEEHLEALTNVSSTHLHLVEEVEDEPVERPVLPQRSQRYDTELKHIVFGIAGSSSLWEKRKEYIKAWWKPKESRGVVWLDKRVRTRRDEGLPEIRISGDTSKFKYTNRQGLRSALRISRVVSETLRLGMKDVRWFVMGDDDTVFVVNNLVRILSKYDHRQFYYVGSSSESHVQNIHFSYAMAYGGGGFAISYPLAKELAKMQDRCIQRYPGLYGSDDRIQACMAELGVPLTREPGFHQVRLLQHILEVDNNRGKSEKHQEG